MEGNLSTLAVARAAILRLNQISDAVTLAACIRTMGWLDIPAPVTGARTGIKMATTTLEPCCQRNSGRRAWVFPSWTAEDCCCAR